MNQLATDLLNQTRSDDEMSIQTAALLRQAADAIEEAEKVNAKLFADYVSAREQLVRAADIAEEWTKPSIALMRAGEMTKQELRTVKAVAQNIADNIRTLSKTDEEGC